jgi:hypothetical protein
VVTHDATLVDILREAGGAVYELVKEAGETVVRDMPSQALPVAWTWPPR